MAVATAAPAILQHEWIMEDFKSHGSHQHPKLAFADWKKQTECINFMWRYITIIFNFSSCISFSLLFFMVVSPLPLLIGMRKSFFSFLVNWILMRYFMVYKREL